MADTDQTEAPAAQPDAPAPAAKAAPAAQPATGPGVITPAKAPPDWSKTTIVVGAAPIPNTNGGAVIVCEGRNFIIGESGEVVGKTEENPSPITLIKEGYAEGGDLYFRTDPDVQFPASAAGKIVTLGRDVTQGGFWGFSPQPSTINVGPAFPAYGAANIAWQKGATEISIVGLSDWEKSRLMPFINALPEGGPIPPEGAPDLRAPALVKITL